MSRTPTVTYLKAYQAPHYFIDEAQLKFVLNDERTTVFSKLLIRKNPESEGKGLPLLLNGEKLTLKHLAIDGVALASTAYVVDEQSLTIHHVPEQFILTIETEIKPQDNTALSGLYRSQDLYCTQCEANGFRRITYYIDRPDVMAKFTVLIEADKARYPILLSNGNCVAQGDLAHGRHWVEWHDPHKKAAYLFALVAGNLVCVEDEFITCTQKRVALQIYVEKGNEARTGHAMESLKQAMRWDEEAYGREYDLGIYMIVAVKDFNMGAMENKGLNIFNAKYILANPQTATDQDYQHIRDVVGHEYFHNWSGNRVTLRDWFQLSLKEGFTVFREQQFSAAMGASSVQRIEEAKLIRGHQFIEDAGPMAHPVRPASYMEINNFYTLTVYEKGSEVIRMLATLLGEATFRKGTDLYFSRYDGHAATTDDFVEVMQTVAHCDLTQFKLWYSQAGTPELTIAWSYASKEQRFTLHVKQTLPATPDKLEKQVMHIPLKMALLSASGAVMHESVLEIKQAQQDFIFDAITEEPVPSLLRGFSAPVKLKVNYTDDALLFIATQDNDSFCRWDATQQLCLRVIDRLIKDYTAGMALGLPEFLKTLIRAHLAQQAQDPALVAMLLQLPSQSYIASLYSPINVEAIYHVCEFLTQTLAEVLRDELADCYQALLQTGPYSIAAQDINKRALKNTCLYYLVRVDLQLAMQQFNVADNMTDSLAALVALNSYPNAMRESALQAFYQKWQHNTLVLDKWFAIQASANVPDVLNQVQALMQHKDFYIKNPNKVYALLGQFSRNNPYYFHQKNGEAYAFLQTAIVELDALNPQVAARIAQAFTAFKHYDVHRKALMQRALQDMQQLKLSNDLYEIVTKSLNE